MLTHTIVSLDNVFQVDVAEILGGMPGDVEPIPAQTCWSALQLSTGDIIHSLGTAQPQDEARRLAVRVAIAAARAAEHLLPSEGRADALKVIEAAEAWVADPSDDNASAAKAAVYCYRLHASMPVNPAARRAGDAAIAAANATYINNYPAAAIAAFEDVCEVVPCDRIEPAVQAIIMSA